MSLDQRSSRLGSGAIDQHHGEEGFTLIELVLAIVIMSLAVVTVVTTMGVAANGSDQQRQQVDVGLALSSAAEAIQNTSYTTAACTSPYTAYATAAAAAAQPPDWSFNPQAVQVSSVDCTSFTYLQQITLTVTSPNQRASGHLIVVKRNPA